MHTDTFYPHATSIILLRGHVVLLALSCLQEHIPSSNEVGDKYTVVIVPQP